MAEQQSTAKRKQLVFLWQGMSKEGNKIDGEMAATGIPAVRSQLQRLGITQTKIKRKPKQMSFGEQKINSEDIALFSRMLTTMLTSGIPLVQALTIIADGQKKDKMKEMIMNIREDVEGGATLCRSLAKFPLYFDELFISLINVGEESGNLEMLLGEIANYKEKTEALKAKVKKALVYPAAVILVSFAVTAILMIFVIPQFESLFAGLGADLPRLTTIIINISRSFQDNWPFVIFIIILLPIGLIKAHKRYPKVSNFFDRLFLVTPVMRVIVKKAAIARFCRTFATMFRSGVPLAESMISVAGATGNIEFKNATLMMKDEVSTGITLNASMKNRGIFPSMVVQMVAIGEESGELDGMLDKVAEFHEREVDDAVSNMTALLEPIIMVVLGGIVGLLVIAMYLPVFQLGTAI